MKKTPEQKTLEMLGKAKGPLTMAEIAKKLKLDPASNDQHYRGMDNLLRRMKTKHQITFVKGPGGGWRITDVGRKVLNDYAPAPKQIKTMPRLTKKPDPVQAQPGMAPPANPPANIIPPAPPVVDQTKLTNHFAIVFDRSGSMDVIQREAEQAGNANIHAIRDQAEKTGQMSTVTVCRFDNEITFDYVMVPAKAAQDFKLQPRNATALIAAVMKTIEKMATFPDADQKSTSFVVQVVTDGEENHSHLLGEPLGTPSRFTWAALEALMREKQATDRWTFAFLVPTQQAKAHLERMGIPAGNIQVWEASAKGAKVMETQSVAAVGAFYATRSVGETASKRYFQPDMSKVAEGDIKAKLTDIRGNCYLWNVDTEQPIQAFVEAKLGHYQPGKAFFPLTKREEVQSFKMVALIDRMSGAIYAGPEARNLLGLPNHDVKVEPGDHGKWEILIQSTSNNRRLVRGSKLLYLK